MQIPSLHADENFTYYVIDKQECSGNRFDFVSESRHCVFCFFNSSQNEVNLCDNILSIEQQIISNLALVRQWCVGHNDMCDGWS